MHENEFQNTTLIFCQTYIRVIFKTIGHAIRTSF